MEYVVSITATYSLIATMGNNQTFYYTFLLMEMLIFLTGVCEHIHLALVAETTSGIKQVHVLIQKQS